MLDLDNWFETEEKFRKKSLNKNTITCKQVSPGNHFQYALHQKAQTPTKYTAYNYSCTHL
jgi:hypothetical protein